MTLKKSQIGRDGPSPLLIASRDEALVCRLLQSLDHRMTARVTDDWFHLGWEIGRYRPEILLIDAELGWPETKEALYRVIRTDPQIQRMILLPSLGFDRSKHWMASWTICRPFDMADLATEILTRMEGKYVSTISEDW